MKKIDEDVSIAKPSKMMNVNRISNVCRQSVNDETKKKQAW